MRKKIKTSNLAFNKYANNMVMDSIVVFVVLFIFVIVGLLSFNMFTEMKTDLVDSDEDFLDNESKDFLEDRFTEFPLWLDGIIITILALFWIVLIGLTFVIESHPIIWALVLFLLIFVIFIAAVISNAYYEISIDDDLYTQSSQLSKTQWVMDRLPYLIVLIIISLIIAILMKSRV